ncbi:hypothetical protein [Novosphingobium sp. FKTRR1]|uniref:hypothetical protein n=1 Tax=Novosphingobium sp. FKTRR1 TaxID=2879118 RepID=UPI001CEFBC05|nr:hypothetical protein [Novosphingobium sp. FKTRR1]
MVPELSHFHDGLLTGIVLGEQAATIFLRKSTGEDYTLMLSGLEVLQMEDFRQGNIILMIEVVSGQLPYLHSGFERLFVPPHPAAAEQYHQAHAGVVARQASRIATGEASLVVIVPSYGADLLAICREVSLAKHHTSSS